MPSLEHPDLHRLSTRSPDEGYYNPINNTIGFDDTSSHTAREDISRNISATSLYDNERSHTPGRGFPSPNKPFNNDYYIDVRDLPRHKVETALSDIVNISPGDATSVAQANDLLNNPTFVSQLLPKDALHLQNHCAKTLNKIITEKTISHIWENFTLSQFYWNYNDVSQQYIKKKYTEKPSVYAYIILAFSHVLYKISLFLKLVLGILENYTSNYDLNFSSKVSVVIFSFVPKVPFAYTLSLMCTALMWPIIGVFLSSQVRSLAFIGISRFIQHAKNKFIGLFSDLRINNTPSGAVKAIDFSIVRILNDFKNLGRYVWSGQSHKNKVS